MKIQPKNHLVLAAVAAALSILTANADTYQWNGDALDNDSNWATDSNWSTTDPFTVPADANISGAHRLNVNGTATLIYSADQGISNFTGDGSARGLAVGSGSSGTMEITGGSFSTLNATGQDVIGNGNNATGTLIISGGEFIGSGAGTLLGVGGGTGRVSNLTISGDGKVTLNSLILNSANIDINLNGGTLELNSFTNQLIESLAAIRLNNGILKARQSTANFIPAHNNLQVLVQGGGAVIDTNGFDITIAEPLLQDFSSPGGNLTKDGDGLLTLAARSTVTGDVTVNAGGLGLSSDPLGSWLPDSLTHAGDLLVFNLGIAATGTPAAIDVLGLTVPSTVTVNIIGAIPNTGQYPLIRYETKNITGSLTLGALPAGVVATLEDDNNGLIYLDVTEIPAPPPGFPVNDTFDVGTGNWFKGTSSGSLSSVNGRLRWAENGSNMAETIGRSFPQQTLSIGETIRLSFDFSLSAGSGNILRVGLFDVTNPITADNWSGSNAIGAWQGYYTFVRDGSSSGNVARRATRGSADGTNGPTSSTAGETTITEPADNTDFALNRNDGVTYQGVFEVTYTASDRMDTLFTLKQGDITHFSVTGVTSTIYNTFDMIAIKTGANAPISFFDNIKLDIIPEPGGFASWITGTFANGSVPTGQQGPDDDPDNDGISNLLEFVLNGDPTVSDPAILPTLDASGSNFVFAYTRRDDSLSPETIQTFQYGSNLVSWTDVIVPAGNATVGAATITVTDNGTTDSVSISIPKTEAGPGGKLFGRLQVTKP